MGCASFTPANRSIVNQYENFPSSITSLIFDALKDFPLNLDQKSESFFSAFDQHNKPLQYDVDTLRQLLVFSALSVVPSYVASETKQKLVAIFKDVPPCFWGDSSSLQQILVALCCAYLHIYCPAPTLYCTQSGATITNKFMEDRIELFSPHLNAEIGILYLLFAKLSENTDYQLPAIKIAVWQIENTLDHNFLPFVGLFSQANQKYEHLLQANALLFQAAAQITANPLFLHAVQKQNSQLNKSTESKKQISFHAAFYLLLSELLEKNVTLTPLTHTAQQIEPKQEIYTPSLNLIGRRKKDISFICSLHGGGTSAGCLQFADMSILAYGPQAGPLGSSNFGILYPYQTSVQTAANGICQQDFESFSIRGTVQIINKLHSSNKIWLDLKQSFSNHQLQIEASYIGTNRAQTISFVFYLKAQTAVVDDELHFVPGSLDRYQGAALPIAFVGSNSCIRFELKHDSMCQMQLIPLAGEDNFWGGNFLLAYTMQAYPISYQWNINCNTT